jgi:hypothetical protein
MAVAVRLDSTGVRRGCIMVMSATIPAARVRVVPERLHEPKRGKRDASFVLARSGLRAVGRTDRRRVQRWGGSGRGHAGTSSNFELVGHDDLSGFELDGNVSPRGMNAAPAIFDRFVYIGNRTDGSSRCGIGDPRRDTLGLGACPRPHPGILVVDVADPASPRVVGEFGTEFATGANLGQTSRELRVWPEQGLLMVMYFRCSSVIHACPPTAQQFRIRFFDLFADPVNPPLIATYVPSVLPHEMFLWIDPKDPDRALAWLSTPTTSVDPNRPNLIITDISRAREQVFTEIATGNWNQPGPPPVKRVRGAPECRWSPSSPVSQKWGAWNRMRRCVRRCSPSGLRAVRRRGVREASPAPGSG